MAIVATPVFQIKVDVREVYPADASSAVSTTENVQMFSDSADPSNPVKTRSDTLVVTTGTPQSLNVQWSGNITLGVSATATLDLTTLASRQGNKTFAKVRKIYIEDLTVPDSVGSTTVSSTGTNGWTNGPFPAAGIALKSAEKMAFDDTSTAGMVVDATHKILSFANGTTARTIRVFLGGE